MEEGKDHFWLREVIKEPKYQAFIQYVKGKVAEKGKEIMMVGELFGEGINNRIIYGKRQIRFFDLYIEDQIRPQKEFFEFMGDFSALCVPVIGRVQGLENALKFPEVFQSKISSGLAEGLVIKPYLKIFRQGGSIFYLKHKYSCSFLCSIKPVQKECISAISLAEGREPTVKSGWLIIFNQVVNEWHELFFNCAGYEITVG